MGYLHIDNLYKNQTILLFKECYALEKVHGTSAHIRWDSNKPANKLTFYSGGVKHQDFVSLFDQEKLMEGFAPMNKETVTVYGEAYGGNCQGMRETYGNKLNFIVFDIQIGKCWLDVQSMEAIAIQLGFEVVPWKQCSTAIEALNQQRDAFSEVAQRRCCGTNKIREGVVLRPLKEMTLNHGDRIIAKHKNRAFEERKTPPKLIDPIKLEVLADASAIAEEWVTPMRLTHVLDKFPSWIYPNDIPKLLNAMVEDVYREAEGEIKTSSEIARAIRAKTAFLLRNYHKPTH